MGSVGRVVELEGPFRKYEWVVEREWVSWYRNINCNRLHLRSTDVGHLATCQLTGAGTCTMVGNHRTAIFFFFETVA